MPTYFELLKRLYEGVVADTQFDFLRSNLAMDMMVSSANEIAALLEFPLRSEEVAVDAAATGFDFSALPADVSEPVLKVHSVALNGFTIPRGTRADILRYRHQPDSNFPRAWFFDDQASNYTLTEQRLDWGPGIRTAGTLTVLLVPDVFPRYDPFDLDTTLEDWAQREPWNGMYPDWSHVVLHRAGMKAMGQEWAAQQVQLYAGLYQQSLREFAAYLGRALPEVPA